MGKLEVSRKHFGTRQWRKWINVKKLYGREWRKFRRDECGTSKEVIKVGGTNEKCGEKKISQKGKKKKKKKETKGKTIGAKKARRNPKFVQQIGWNVQEICLVWRIDWWFPKNKSFLWLKR